MTTDGPAALPAAVEQRAAEDSQADGRGLRRFALLVGIGWLGTNTAYSIAELPMQLLLKEKLKLEAQGLSAFFALAHFTNYIKPLAGVLSDAIPFMGTRRRHYLLIGLTVCGLLWLLLGIVPRSYWSLLGAYGFMYIFVVLISTVLGGLMAEGGARYNATGRLSAQRIGIFRLVGLIGGPVGGWLASRAFSLTTWIAGGLHLALVPLFYFHLREPRTARIDYSAIEAVKEQARQLVRARTLWAAAGLVCLVILAPGFNTPLLYYQRDTLKFSPEQIGILKLVGAVFGMAGALVYSLICGRSNLRRLLAWSILVHASGTLFYLAYSSYSAAIYITALEGVAQTLAVLPLYDLAVRATPRGSEAIGYAVMMSVWNLTNALSDLFGSWMFGRFGVTFMNLVWLNSGTTILVLIAVPFLPAILINRREGESVAVVAQT